MSHPLHERLLLIRRRIRQTLLLYGLSWVTVVFLGAPLLVGTVDWLLHLDDPSLRLFLALLIAGVTIATAWRFLIAPLRVRIRDLDLAMRLEARYPHLRDSFASTVQFLDQGLDPRLGSPALQRRLIDQTLSQVERINLDDLIQTEPARRIAIAAGIVCLVTAFVAGFHRAEAATALQRLAFPFADHPWPKQTHLLFVGADLKPLKLDPEQPIRIARGDTFEFWVINTNGAGRLPERVYFEELQPDGQVRSDPLPPATLRSRGGAAREACPVNLVVKGPLTFRAVGGDDREMSWFRLDVVPPPVVETLQVTLHPPAYTGRPVEKLPPGAGHVEALVGTRVALSAVANKPLGSAALRVQDQQKHPITVGKDKRQLTGAFEIKEAGEYSYWLDLKDEQGFENSNSPRYTVRATHDSVPEISIELPAADGIVTAEADVFLRTIAKDDLGLKEIRLRYRTQEQSGDSPAATVPLFDGTGRPTQQTTESTWSLAPLKLAPGTQITFHAEALDDFDLGPPHIGRSLTRTLTIATSEEKTQELIERQAGLLADLDRAARQQTEAHARVGELKLQLEKTGALRPEDLDLLKRVEAQQQEVSRLLKETPHGVEARSRELLREFQDNHLADPEAERRLTQIADELQRLRLEQLPRIDQELTQARTDAERGMESAGEPGERRLATPPSSTTSRNQDDNPENNKPSAPPSETKPPKTSPATETPADDDSKAAEANPLETSVAKSLDIAEADQQAVEETLSELLQQLSQWRDRRDVLRDVGELIAGQNQLNEEAAEIGKQTLGKPLPQLTPQEQADLARLGERQQKQADRLEQLQSKMDDMLRAADPHAKPGPLEDALGQSRQEGTPGRMKDAAREISGNNVARATEVQQDVLQKLKEMDDILQNKGESDEEQLVKKLKDAEDELEQLHKRQEELMQKVEAAEQIADPAEREEELAQLRKEQQQLQEEVEGMARRLRRLQPGSPDDAAGGAARRAAERMEQADEALEKGEPEQAAAQQQEALDDLEQARRELAQERQEAEERLAREQFAKIADQLQGMIARQQQVIEETLRLETLRANRGNWTRGELKSLRDLGETQKSVQVETERIIEVLTPAAVFALALKGAARQMETAVTLLTERQAGVPTQQAEKAALQRLKDLIAALQEDPDDKAPAPQAGGGAEGEQPEKPASNAPQGEAIPTLAQLRLLKTLQQDLVTRTTELASRPVPPEGRSATDLEELQALAREQGELADLVRNMTKLASPAAPAEQEAEPSLEKPDAEPSKTDPPAAEDE